MKVSKINNTRIGRSSVHLIGSGLAACCLLLPVVIFSQVDSTRAQKDSARIFAQQDSAHQQIFHDSLQTDQDSAAIRYYDFVRKFRDELVQKNIAEYTEDTISTKQDVIIEEIRRLTLEAETHLNSGLDTSGLSNELAKIEKWYNLASEGVFINTGTIQTHRNLETSYQVLRELLTRTLARKESLDNYYKKLVEYRNRIDSLYQDKVLYMVSADSVTALRYINKLIVVAEQIKPIDNAIKKTHVTVSELQITVNRFVNILNTGIEQIGVFQNDLSGKTFSRETSNLGGPVKSFRPFKEIIEYSIIKSGVAFLFYIRNETGRIILLLVLVCLCAIFFISLKKNLQSKGWVNDNPDRPPLLKYPVLSALVIVLNIFQFIFPDPPFVFNAVLWTVSSVSLIIIIKNFMTRYWMITWIVAFALFLLACADNLVLQASRPERWIMLSFSIAGIIAGSYVIVTGPRHQLREKVIVYFIAFVIIMQIVSALANIYGRFNLSKACFTSGFFNLVVAILFFWTVRFINEALALASKAYQVPGKKLFRINFDRVGNKVPSIFYVLVVVGWFVLFARNFYAHKMISVPIKDFVSKDRFIGQFSFTVESLLLFFLILYLTGFCSRLVSFFSSDGKHENERNPGKGGLGSWVLMVRVAIILVGFLLALAAIGVPLDRLTIVLSALGIGIGFGLQALVNNLVSGLIISFEKPVNVGDVVEISGRSGTIKSIGFRSSRISTGDGADVVIPNGDLLNQHLVNWSRDGSSRSVKIIAGLAHGTNLEKAIQILKALPAKDKRVLSYPEPSVIIMDYKENSIEIQFSFWVRNEREWRSVKSDMILAMDAALKKNGIEAPVPRREITVHSFEKEGSSGKEGIEPG